MKYFSCKPKKEAFCCFTERISLLPSDVRKYKDEWESGGVIFPFFRGIVKKSLPITFLEMLKITKYNEGIVNIGDGLIAYLELQFFPLVPYEEELSEEFKAYLKNRFGLKGKLAFRCPFLEKGNKCKIHENKPLSCRRYPWSFAGIQTECLECGKESFSSVRKEGYMPVNQLKKEWKIEAKKREGGFKEWHSFVKKLFDDEEVLTEVFQILSQMDWNSFKDFASPNVVIPIVSITKKVYEYLGIDVYKQEEVVRKAKKLAEAKGEEGLLRDYELVHSHIKTVIMVKNQNLKPVVSVDKVQLKKLLKSLVAG